MSTGRFGPNPITATVAADGTATVRFQTPSYPVVVSNVSVSVSTKVLESVATLYRNVVSPTTRLDGTQSGSTGDATSDPFELYPGESLLVQWTGADVGATATATFSGTSEVTGGFRAF